MPDNTINNPNPGGEQNPPDSQPKSETFETWLAVQPDNVKTLYEGHVAGLKSAVKATRDERDTLAKQLKDLLPKAEKGSELEKLLTEAGAKLEASERRAAFLESATQPGIDCRNPKAALALALSLELFDRRGNPDWAAIKQEAPELFGKANPPGNGGAGSQNPPQKTDMNTFIRRMAGRE